AKATQTRHRVRQQPGGVLRRRAWLRRVAAHRGVRPRKNPAGGRVFCRTYRAGSGSSLCSLDAGVQARLVAGGLVLVDQATRAEPVEDRLGDLERFLGRDDVVLAESLEDPLDGGAQHRALAGVAGVAHDSLLGALLGGLDVGHDYSWKIV